MLRKAVLSSAAPAAAVLGGGHVAAPSARLGRTQELRELVQAEAQLAALYRGAT